jgi:hypothetical protein
VGDLSARHAAGCAQFYQQMKHLPVLRLSYSGLDQYDSISQHGQPLPIMGARMHT